MQLQAKKTKDRCPLLEATEQKRTFYQFSGRAWNKKNKWKQKEARLRVTPILFISAPSKIPHLILVVGEGNGTPLQYSCLENPMDGGAWWAAVHGVAKSWTQLSDFTFTFHFPALEKEMVTHSSSCLENPRDGGAWWAAVHGVAQSRIWLKWLSSSSSNPCCCRSVTQSCPTLCDPMDCSMPGFPVLHYLPEFAQIPVHWVSDVIQPSHPLSSASPPALNLSPHQGLFLK